MSRRTESLTPLQHRMRLDRHRHAPCRAAGCEDPEEPLRAGECFLVGVDGEQGALIRLYTNGPQSQMKTGRGFDRLATTALQRANAEAPFLMQPVHARSGNPWAAQVALVSGGIEPRSLEGDSYGLAVHLAAIAWVADIPLRGDVLCLAGVEGEKLFRVDRLKTKLDFVQAELPGTRAVIVASEQREEALKIVGQGDLEVVHVEHLAECIPAAFGRELGELATDATKNALKNLDGVDSLVRRLFRIVLPGNQPWLGWRAARRTAEALLPHTVDASARRMAEVVVAVTARHEGESVAFPDPNEEWFASLPRPIRLMLIAQAVQHQGDSGRIEATFLSDSEAHVASKGERHREDLHILGALGRAHLAAGDFTEAARVLNDAVESWFALLEAPSASHALSALLLVTGLSGSKPELDRLEASHVSMWFGEPETDTVSRAFVKMAFGRAQIQCGALRSGSETLKELLSGERAYPVHVRASALRWRRRAAAELGDSDAAQAARSELIELVEREPGLREQLLLSQLDEALAEGREVDALIEELGECQSGLPILERCRREALNPQQTARCMAEEYPY